MSVVALGSVAAVLTTIYPLLFLVIGNLNSHSDKVVPLSLLLVILMLVGIVLGFVAAGNQDAETDSDQSEYDNEKQPDVSFILLLSGAMCALAVPVVIMTLFWVQGKEDSDDVPRPGATKSLKTLGSVLWAGAIAMLAAGTVKSQKD